MVTGMQTNSKRYAVQLHTKYHQIPPVFHRFPVFLPCFFLIETEFRR